MMVLAMIEYSLDLDLPDVVFESPIIKAMSDATTDLMTWPNVCHSFDVFWLVLICSLGPLFFQRKETNSTYKVLVLTFCFVFRKNNQTATTKTLYSASCTNAMWGYKKPSIFSLRC
jgi:hypothetical protein